MNTATVIAAAALAVAGYALVSERQFLDEVAQSERAWMRADACAPSRPHERAVLDMRADGSTQCAIYTNAGYGRAPRLVYAEARTAEARP